MGTRIIMRQATDDFGAFVVADAMERCGCEVVSIVYREMDHMRASVQANSVRVPLGQCWHIFARYRDTHLTPDEIDGYIEKAMEDPC